MSINEFPSISNSINLTNQCINHFNDYLSCNICSQRRAQPATSPNFSWINQYPTGYMYTNLRKLGEVSNTMYLNLTAQINRYVLNPTPLHHGRIKNRLKKNSHQYHIRHRKTATSEATANTNSSFRTKPLSKFVRTPKMHAMQSTKINLLIPETRHNRANNREFR